MRKFGVYVYKILLLFEILRCCKSQNDTENEVDENARAVTLQDILPKWYDSVRPPRYKGNATQVDVRIFILNVRDLNENEMSFTVDIFMQHFWEDRRLVFPSWVKEQRVVINVKWLSSVWHPDLYFENSIDSKVNQLITPNLYMVMYKNHTIYFFGRYTLTASCDMNLHRFPHDVQTCDLKILSLSYTNQEMILRWTTDGGLRLGRNIVLPQFEILNLSSYSRIRRVSVGTTSSLTAQLCFKRLDGFYVISVYVPTVLIVFMSMLTFWIPPEAVAARVTLGVTSLLTMITKQYQSGLPNVSYVVALNVWMSCCIAFVFCGLLEYAIVIVLKTKLGKREAIKNAAEPIEHEEKGNTQLLYCHGKCGTAIICGKEKPNIFNAPHLIDCFSRFFFPAAFMIMAVIYWNKYAKS